MRLAAAPRDALPQRDDRGVPIAQRLARGGEPGRQIEVVSLQDADGRGDILAVAERRRGGGHDGADRIEPRLRLRRLRGGGGARLGGIGHRAAEGEQARVRGGGRLDEGFGARGRGALALSPERAVVLVRHEGVGDSPGISRGALGLLVGREDIHTGRSLADHRANPRRQHLRETRLAPGGVDAADAGEHRDALLRRGLGRRDVDGDQRGGGPRHDGFRADRLARGLRQGETHGLVRCAHLDDRSRCEKRRGQCDHDDRGDADAERQARQDAFHGPGHRRSRFFED